MPRSSAPECRPEHAQRVQQPVHEGRGVVGGQRGGEGDRLRDGDGVVDLVVVQEFPHRHAQDGPIHRGQPFQRPALQVGGQHLVDLREVGGHAVDDVRGVLGQRRLRRGDGEALLQQVGQLQRTVAAALVRLEQHVDRAASRLRPCRDATVGHQLARPR